MRYYNGIYSIKKKSKIYEVRRLRNVEQQIIIIELWG